MHLTRGSTLNFLPLTRVSIAHGVWASSFTLVDLEIAIDNERGPVQPHFAKNACFYQDPIGPCSGWRTIAQQWAAKAQISGQWHKCSRQWAAMTTISRQCAAMAQFSGQWHTISRQWPSHGSDFSAMAHNFSAMGSNGTQFLGNGPAMAQISRQWAALARNCPAMAQISRPWLIFLGNGQP